MRFAIFVQVKQLTDMMKRIALLLILALSSLALKAQDPPPEGGFPNPKLSVNRSGKVVLTYSRWDKEIVKGTPALVFFWASWSDESRELAPEIEKVYQKYGTTGKIKVLGVPYGDEISDTMEAVSELGLKFTHLFDVEDDLAGPFDLGSVPLVVLIGADGTVIKNGLQGDEILKAVEEIL